MLNPSHKAKRLAFASKHLVHLDLSRRTAFSEWMFADNKVFLRHRASGKTGVKMWYPQDCRPIDAVAMIR